MESTTQDEVAPQTEEDKRKAEAERHEAYKEAAVELGKGIALGLVPFLGQAIDVYDTIESALTLYNAKKKEDEEEAQFDLVLAIVGWIPGPGDGVKKSLRLVNKNPDRFAPVLFDLLRFVLQECGIHTSPEALLEEIFNASKLKAQLQSIKQGIEESSAFESLPEGAQHAVKSTMNVAMASLPVMVLVVEKRLKKWTKKQPNGSARETTGRRADKPQPGSKKDAGSEGHARPASGSAGDAVRSQAATQALTELTNELVGISGEHIADYICAYTFGWGKDWKGHDDGTQGRWTEGTPSKTKPGKLSKGGSPKANHVLYKLTDGANGTGIDAVWRAEGHNGGKPYAIVEAKASRDEDAPKFLRKLNNTRKPSITSSLGVNVITDPVELIEPLDGDEQKPGDKSNGGKKGGGKKGGGKVVSSTPTSATQQGAAKPARGTKPSPVQMSHEWIRQNIPKAVGMGVAPDVLRKFAGDRTNYSRHLFFSPLYHLSGSPKAHLFAKQLNQAPDMHSAHDAFHYGESEVNSAVNKRKARLRKKFGNLPSLKDDT